MKYNSILRLDKMLTDEGIPHGLNKLRDGYQVTYYGNSKEIIADAIECEGSYGNRVDLLEIMGLIEPEETDDMVLGYLSASNVFNRIKKHWEKCKNDK